MEIVTIHALVDALDALRRADDATRNGFVSDHIQNAIAEITKAMVLAINARIDA